MAKNEQIFNRPQNLILDKRRKSGAVALLGKVKTALVFCGGSVARQILKFIRFTWAKGPNRPPKGLNSGFWGAKTENLACAGLGGPPPGRRRPGA